MSLESRKRNEGSERERERERAALLPYCLSSFLRSLAVKCFSSEPHFVNTPVDCEKIHEGKRVLDKSIV